MLMSSDSRPLKFSLAINEALYQSMETDADVMLIGQGVKSPWYVGQTAHRLLATFGPERVIDTPVSENAITGAAVGAAIAGMKPVVVHPRMDFMFYAFDPMMNEAANWRYMSAGRAPCSVVFWGIINRGGEQGAQHSQALHALFAHIPGLKVVMPSTPFDAKGLLIAAIREPNPVVFIDDRFLYEITEEVPQKIYEVPIGKGIVRRLGTDVTMISISYGAHLTMKAAAMLADKGIEAEVVDLRSAKPIDIDLIKASVKKTGKVAVVDVGWRSFGVSAEVSALIHEHCFSDLRRSVLRIALPDIPAPAARTLEKDYYFNEYDIAKNVMELLAPNDREVLRYSQNTSVPRIIY